MAEDILGGLNAVNQPVEEAPAMEEAPVAKEQTEESIYKGDATERLRKQRLAYDSHLQKMIESFKGRTANLGYDPKLLALSKGFLTPGKTGNFFESLGTAFGGYGDAAQEEQKLKLEDELTKEKLLGLQLGQTKEDYALEKELKGRQYLQDVVSGKIGRAGAPTTIARTDKLSVPDAYSLIEGAQDPQSGVRITKEMVVAAPTKETQAILEKMYDNQQKEDEFQQKEFGSTKTTLPVIGEPTENITIGQAREIKKLDMATRNMPIEERTAIFNQYYQDKGILGRRAVVSPTGKTTEQFETPQQRATRVEGEKETVKETAKSNVKDIEFLETRRDSAVDQINDAKAVYTIATNPQTKNAFGILSRPGVASAFGELVREPLKFGDISVGVSNIENIIRKAGGTQEEINAAAIVARNIAKLELGFSQAFKGQGQVSDNERLIVRNVGPQISDNPKVAALKAESIIARAEFDSGLATKFAQWQESHPNGTVRQFKGSPEYNTVKTGYDNKLGNILSKYGMTPARVETEKSTSSPKKGGSLWEAIQNAKESE
jgi:hypothetical protein